VVLILMDTWLMVVIGWGVVGPVLAVGVSYALSWAAGKVSWQPGCRLSGSLHRPVVLAAHSRFCGYSFGRAPHADCRHVGPLHR